MPAGFCGWKEGRSMKPERFSLPRHACKMLRRNFRGYGLLSVTIVLSFSILLGYLCFVDAGLYNRYKELFAAPEQVVIVSTYDRSPAKMQALGSMAEYVDPDANMYHYIETTTPLTQFGDIIANLTFLPAGSFPVYREVYSENYVWNAAQEIRPILGRERFSLKGNEAIVSESFYAALGGDGTFPMELAVPFTWADGSTTVFSLQIVGVCGDKGIPQDVVKIAPDASGKPAGMVQIYLPQSVLQEKSAADMENPRRMAWFYSASPEKIADCADQLQLVVNAVCREQKRATEQIQVQKATKATIAAIMLLLLGVNLYSSFTNALAERKYEIGIKRAIGASAWDIVRQFFMEGLLVMLANILLSVLLVTDLLCLYKLYRLLSAGEQWVIAVSPYSAAMFGVCSMTLTLVFCILFAYRSTQVEVVQYLKAE